MLIWTHLQPKMKGLLTNWLVRLKRWLSVLRLCSHADQEPQLIAAQAEVQTLRAELAQAMAARAHNDSDQVHYLGHTKAYPFQHEIAKARETVHALRAELKQAMAAQAQQAADLQEAREEQQRLRSEVLERADDSEEDVEGLKVCPFRWFAWL